MSNTKSDIIFSIGGDSTPLRKSLKEASGLAKGSIASDILDLSGLGGITSSIQKYANLFSKIFQATTSQAGAFFPTTAATNLAGKLFGKIFSDSISTAVGVKLGNKSITGAVKNATEIFKNFNYDEVGKKGSKSKPIPGYDYGKNLSKEGREQLRIYQDILQEMGKQGIDPSANAFQEAAKATKGLAAAEGEAASGEAALGSALITGIGVVLALAAAATAAATATAQWAQNLVILSRQLGKTEGDIINMQNALHFTGASADEAASIMKSLRDNLYAGNPGFNATISSLNMLGLSYDKIAKMDPAQQFETIAEAINEHGNAMQRAAIATTIFGEAGARMVAAHNKRNPWAEGALHIGQSTDVALNASQLSNLSSNWEELKNQVVEFAKAVGTLVAPVVNLLVHLMEGLMAVINAVIHSWNILFGSIYTGLEKTWDALTGQKEQHPVNGKPLGAPVISTFDSLRHMGGGFGPNGMMLKVNDPAEKTAENTSRTAKATETLVDIMRRDAGDNNSFQPFNVVGAGIAF